MPNIILEIVGTNFANYPFDNLVTFNLGAVGFVTAATPTKLTVQLTTNPTTTGSLTAVVANPLSSGSPVQVAIVGLNVVGTVNAANRSFVSTSTLTIAGTGFDATAANNTVTFNLGAVGTVTSATTTQLTITFSTFPDSNGSLTAIVDVVDYLSSIESEVATIVSQAVVTENLLTHPLNEATLIIDGTGFDSVTPANNIVTFSNGAIGTVTAATAIELTVTLTTFPTDNQTFTAIVNSFGGDSEEEIVGFYNGIVDEGATELLSTNQTSIGFYGFLLSQDNNFAYIMTDTNNNNTTGINCYTRNTATGILTYASNATFNNNFAGGDFDKNMIITSDGLFLFSLGRDQNVVYKLNKFSRNNSTGALTYDSQITLDSYGLSIRFNSDTTKLYLATHFAYKRYSVSSGVLTLDWSVTLGFNLLNERIQSSIISNNDSYSVLMIAYGFGNTNTPYLRIIDNSDGSIINADVPDDFYNPQALSYEATSLAKSSTGNYLFLYYNANNIGIYVAELESNGDISSVDTYTTNSPSPPYILNNRNTILFDAANHALNFDNSSGELTHFETVQKKTILFISKDNKFMYGFDFNDDEYDLYSLISLDL